MMALRPWSRQVARHGSSFGASTCCVRLCPIIDELRHNTLLPCAPCCGTDPRSSNSSSRTSSSSSSSSVSGFSSTASHRGSGVQRQRTAAPAAVSGSRQRRPSPLSSVAQPAPAEAQHSDAAAAAATPTSAGSSGSSSHVKPALVMPTPILPTSQLDVAAFANGALLIDKPKEWTSTDVCIKVRNSLFRAMGKLKVGHAGTLDPMATGLLVVCTGKGTKAIDTFVSMNKQYSGTLRLGEGTATYDAEADVTERLAWEHITDDEIRHAISTSLLGDILQVPPMYSAIKIKGQKLYDLARCGQVIDRPARPINVSRFHVQRDTADPQLVHFTVDCSKGTYVRSLAHDLGRALGSAAHLTALRRESIGDLCVKDAWSLQQLLEQVQQMKLQVQP